MYSCDGKSYFIYIYITFVVYFAPKLFMLLFIFFYYIFSFFSFLSNCTVQVDVNTR